MEPKEVMMEERAETGATNTDMEEIVNVRLHV